MVVLEARCETAVRSWLSVETCTTPPDAGASGGAGRAGAAVAATGDKRSAPSAVQKRVIAPIGSAMGIPGAKDCLFNSDAFLAGPSSYSSRSERVNLTARR